MAAAAPYADASPSYAEKFQRAMKGPRQSSDSVSHQSDNRMEKERAARSLAAQTLWDASMADAMQGNY
jgi:hypothetical protein